MGRILTDGRPKPWDTGTKKAHAEAKRGRVDCSMLGRKTAVMFCRTSAVECLLGPSIHMSVQQPSLKAFLETNPTALIGQGATEDEITAAERELGVTFPSMFRSYLAELGYLEFRSAEFYGLGARVPAHLDLVRNTKAERTEFHLHIPPHLIPFMPNGCGDHYCIDLSASADDPSVVFWDHELDTGQQPQKLADTFSSWLLRHTHEWA